MCGWHGTDLFSGSEKRGWDRRRLNRVLTFYNTQTGTNYTRTTRVRVFSHQKCIYISLGRRAGGEGLLTRRRARDRADKKKRLPSSTRLPRHLPAGTDLSPMSQVVSAQDRARIEGVCDSMGRSRWSLVGEWCVKRVCRNEREDDNRVKG
ncbi:hypothetical protein BC827DRAFT_1233819 [Russula dissimulans]|nr:hypothetical protein BC827DRAFT_1233819 [Russula dissimulans]